MAFMERITTPVTDGERAVVRLLRLYCGMRDHDSEGTGLSHLVAFGQSLRLRLPPAGIVALASVFQLTEAVLGRRLVAECCCSHCLSGDERAVIRLLSSHMPTLPGTATPDIPPGLPGALAWAVLSVRRLCSDIVPRVPKIAVDDADCCPFTPASMV